MSAASSSLLYYNKLQQSTHIGGQGHLGTWSTNSMQSEVKHIAYSEARK